MNDDHNQHAYLRTSALWAVYENFTTIYLVAFAILLGASNFAIAVLASLPYIAVALSETLGAKLTERWHRVPIILVTYAIDKAMWIFIALMPYVTYERPIVTLGTFFFFNQFFLALREPALVSLVADIAPAQKATYFARVNRATGAAGMIATLAAGFFLQWMGKTNPLGYTLLFLVGALFGYITMWSFGTMRERDGIQHVHHSLRDIFRYDGVFRSFCLRASFFWFAARVGGPLVTAYMLRDLGLPLPVYAASTAVYTISQIVFYKPLGRIADRFGDRLLALIGVFGTSGVMMLWFLITPSTTWLIWPTQIFSGLVWAATELSLFNLLLDVSTKENRPLQTAQYSTMAAIAQAAGALLGGFIVKSEGIGLLVGIPLVLLVSAGLRFAAGMLFVQLRAVPMKTRHSVSSVLHFVLHRGFFQPRHHVHLPAGKSGKV